LKIFLNSAIITVLHYRMGQQREVLWRGHKITKMALMPRYNYIIRIFNRQHALPPACTILSRH